MSTSPLPAVTDATFHAEVLTSELPVLVDFWAPWCGPCKKVAPVLAEIAAEHPHQLKIVKLDIDDNPQIARDYGIMSIPNMILFIDGQPAAQIVGAKSKSKLLVDLFPFLT